MHTENKLLDQSSPERKSFIEQARRSQIIEATIDTLAAYGYVNTSFARIARQTGISPSLISYHFKNKEDLTNEVFKWVMNMRSAYLQEKMAGATTATEKLRIALEADMTNLGTQPKYFQAMNEVVFSKRDDKGSLVFLGGGEDPALTMLRDILKLGQKSGEFRKFDADDFARIIDGARDTFLAQIAQRPEADLGKFTKNLISFALKVAVKETRSTNKARKLDGTKG